MNIISNEILFRGKEKCNGKWVFGDFFREWDVFENLNSYIFENPKYGSWYKHEIIPETVGRYTGLKDKNGVKIFEGDIVKLSDGYAFPIIFKDGCFLIACGDSALPLALFKEREVIGNIHDNPELLGGDRNV